MRVVAFLAAALFSSAAFAQKETPVRFALDWRFGGPAALVARELDTRPVDTICVTSYESDGSGQAATVQGRVEVIKRGPGDGEGYLLIDDFVDTGRTAQAVHQLLSTAYFAALHAKPAGRAIVDTFVKEFKQNKWIHFPWDIEYRFATPIKEGGRVTAGPG